MGKLLTPTLQIIPILSLYSILNSTRNRIINTQNRALNKLNLPSRITTKIVPPRRSLPLAPRLGRRGFRARIRRGHSAGHTKACSGVIVRVLLSQSLRICGVGFGQTVAGRRSGDGRGAALLLKGVLEGAAVGALVLVEERLGGVAILSEVVLL